MKAKCYDPNFVYVPSVKTNIRKTFNRIRRELKLVEEKESPPAVVVPIVKRK